MADETHSSAFCTYRGFAVRLTKPTVVHFAPPIGQYALHGPELERLLHVGVEAGRSLNDADTIKHRSLLGRLDAA
jgi:hypothetical protein